MGGGGGSISFEGTCTKKVIQMGGSPRVWQMARLGCRIDGGLKMAWRDDQPTLRPCTTCHVPVPLATRQLSRDRWGRGGLQRHGSR